MFEFDEIFLEQRTGAIVPDVVAQKGSKSLLVEFAVTHFCDDLKVKKIRRLGLSAVEIDLSGLARDASLEEWVTAIVETAPRQWLHNPRIEEASRELSEKILRERARKKERADQTKNEWVAKIESAKMAASDSANESQKKIYFIVCDAGFSEIVGKSITGSFCFRISECFWQSYIVYYFVIRPSREHENYSFSLNDCLKFLRDGGFIRPGFNAFIGEDTERLVRDEVPSFRTPFRVVLQYLDFLENQGLLVKDWRSWHVSSHISQDIKTSYRIDAERPERIRYVRELVVEILNFLAQNEASVFDFECWLDHQQSSIGCTARNAIGEGRAKYSSLLNSLRQIERMMREPSYIPSDRLHLPLEEECDRRQETKEFKKLEAERAKALNRIETLEKSLELYRDSSLGTWLYEPNEKLAGNTPCVAAHESEKGLAKALNLLDHRYKELTAERARLKRMLDVKEKLAARARTILGEERAELFLRSTHPKIGLKRPYDYCMDETSLGHCLDLLPKSKS